MEQADAGDLNEKISYRLKRKALFNEDEIYNYFIQIVKGLHGLHKLNI